MMHTPGPWEAEPLHQRGDKYADFVAHIAETNGKCVARVAQSSAVAESTCASNVALFAAAPALLATLEKAMRIVYEAGNQRELFAEIIEVVAKAKGRP